MLGSWIKTNVIDGLSLVSLDSSVEEASRSDFYSLILRMKEHRSIIFTSKFAKLDKHPSEKLKAEISNDGHPCMIEFPIDCGDSFYSIVLEVDHSERCSTVSPWSDGKGSLSLFRSS
jgi:hypothetical protein